MITFKTKKLEEVFAMKCILNKTSLGLDIANRTGWCKAIANPKEIILNYSYIDAKSSDKFFRYDTYIEILKNIIKNSDIVTIEDTYYSLNVKSFQSLTRLGGFAYTVAKLYGIKDVRYLLAVSARSKLGLPCKKKKDEVHKVFCEKLKLKLEDPDIIDAIILSLCGILEPTTLLNGDK